MRPGLPAAIASRGYAGGGIVPALLLDVQDPAGNNYYWADRPLNGIPTALTPGVVTLVNYVPWVTGAGTLNLYRALQTDTLTLTLQNLSGDVLQSDFEKIVRKETLDGSLFVFRYYQVDAGFAWIEQHGTLSIGSTARTSATLNCTQLLQGQDDTPLMQVSENCQLVWAQPRCGAQGPTECLYTFASCQVPERFTGIQTAFEVNNPATAAAVITDTINRRRSW